MRTVQVTGYGDVDKLGLVNQTVPEPKENEVLIKVQACAVNNTEIWMKKAHTVQAQNRAGDQKVFISLAPLALI